MTFEITGGSFAGEYELSPAAVDHQTPVGVIAGVFSGADLPADVQGHFTVLASHEPYPIGGNIENGLAPRRNVWLITNQTTSALQVDASYPFQFSFLDPQSPPEADDSLDDTQGYYRYPGTGPGSCSLIVDSYRAGTNEAHTCLHARFSCTGLSGAETGESFNVVDGKLSVGE